jgi:hypothetical protein
MRIPRLLVTAASAALIFGTAAPTFAAETGTVDATVTVATPCINVLTPTLDFGTLPFSSGNVLGSAQQAFRYENCGEAAEHIWAAGTDAVGTSATWTLSGLPPAACNGTLNVYSVDAANYNLTNQAQDIESLAAGDTNFHTAVLYMPCVGSDGAGATMSFRILLTATF